MSVGIFFVSWGEKISVGKKFGRKFVGLKKKCPAIPRNVRTFPGMQDGKTAEAEKKPLGPRGEKKRPLQKKKLSVGILFGRLGKKMSVGKKSSFVSWSKNFDNWNNRFGRLA